MNQVEGPFRAYVGEGKDADEGLVFANRADLDVFIAAHPDDYMFVRNLTDGSWFDRNADALPAGAEGHND